MGRPVRGPGKGGAASSRFQCFLTWGSVGFLPSGFCNLNPWFLGWSAVQGDPPTKFLGLAHPRFLGLSAKRRAQARRTQPQRRQAV